MKKIVLCMLLIGMSEGIASEKVEKIIVKKTKSEKNTKNTLSNDKKREISFNTRNISISSMPRKSQIYGPRLYSSPHPKTTDVSKKSGNEIKKEEGKKEKKSIGGWKSVKEKLGHIKRISGDSRAHDKHIAPEIEEVRIAEAIVTKELRNKKEIDRIKKVLDDSKSDDKQSSKTHDKYIAEIRKCRVLRKKMIEDLRNDEKRAMDGIKKAYNVGEKMWGQWMHSAEKCINTIKSTVYKESHEQYTHDRTYPELYNLTIKVLKKNGINPKSVNIQLGDINNNSKIGLLAKTFGPECVFSPIHNSEGKIVGMDFVRVAKPASLIFDEKCIKLIVESKRLDYLEKLVIDHEVEHLGACHYVEYGVMEQFVLENFGKINKDASIAMKSWKNCQEETAEFKNALMDEKSAAILLKIYEEFVLRNAIEPSTIHPTPMRCYKILKMINDLWALERQVKKFIYIEGDGCMRSGMPMTGILENKKNPDNSGMLDNENTILYTGECFLELLNSLPPELEGYEDIRL
ncbi:MAG TPA: hypothetical protein VEK38_04670 [Candidatus Bathyarchaeia archaeon]|nr:hypothetical protein [Candidatus Bathyarchaeia archaeon]